MVTFRPATNDDLPYLKQRLAESPEEKVHLESSVVHVAEENGEIIGLLPVRLIWQAEPLLIFREVKNRNTRRRVALGLPRIMESWLADRTKNRTGIYSYFFVSKNRLWGKLAQHFGALRIYKGCMTFGRDL